MNDIPFTHYTFHYNGASFNITLPDTMSGRDLARQWATLLLDLAMYDMGPSTLIRIEKR